MLTKTIVTTRKKLVKSVFTYIHIYMSHIKYTHAQ